MKLIDWILSKLFSLVIFAGSDDYRKKMKDVGYGTDIVVTEEEKVDYEKQFLAAQGIK